MSMIKISALNLLRRKNRTILAILGIVIGIAALTVLIGLVDGIYFDATESIGQLQGIFVYKSSVPDPVMSQIDSSYENKLKTIPGIGTVTKEIYHLIGTINGASPETSYMDMPFFFGVDPSDFESCSYSVYVGEILKGRNLRPNDVHKIILKEDFADQLNINVGQAIKIDGQKFKIVGIYEMESSMGGNPIVGTFEDAKELYEFGPNKVSAFYVSPINPNNSKNLSQIIEFKFDKLQAQGQQEMMEQIGDMVDNIKLLSIFVSIIAAVVAGIGVINTMLMSVMERMREIGTLKAVGWTRKDIIIMIILESIIIGILGSIFGLLLGYLFGTIISANLGLSVLITTQLIIQNFLYGLILGTLGGLYPAWVASNMSPVDALHS